MTGPSALKQGQRLFLFDPEYGLYKLDLLNQSYHNHSSVITDTAVAGSGSGSSQNKA